MISDLNSYPVWENGLRHKNSFGDVIGDAFVVQVFCLVCQCLSVTVSR